MGIIQFISSAKSGLTIIRHRLWFAKLIVFCAFMPANTWTALRLLGAPVVIYLLVIEQIFWALIAFVLFALTDLIDGPVATVRNEQSQKGAFWDAVVDKLFILPIIYYMAVVNQLIWPILFWYMVIIEIGGRLFLGLYWYVRKRKYDYHANRWGKRKFTLQAYLIGILFLSYFGELNIWGITWTMIGNVLLVFVNILATISVLAHINPPQHS